MPTAKRQVYDNAIYHVIQKGNNGKVLFESEKDYFKFISLIKEHKGKYSFELYNYCLMNNHLHLLVKVFKKEELSKLAQGLFQSYRFYFKRQYDYSGHLYQGRYKSNIIDKDEYLLECARYIETNPLRARVIKKLEDYKWSSYNFYAYGEQNSLLTTHPLYETFGEENKQREFYRLYVMMPRIHEEVIDKTFKI
ncbi:MAG: transposase [Candidatus Omnitrophica bacterium]|nr:transposase [Candidatus Omnitrophota bacterium]